MKTKLLLLFCIATLSASAQERGFSVEPLIGYGITQAVENKFFGPGEKAGVGSAYMFNENIGISTGIQGQQYSENINIHDAEDACPFCGSMVPHWKITSASVNYKFNYLELPLNVRFITSKNNKLGFFAETGLVLGYYVSGIESGSGSVTGALMGEYNGGFSVAEISPNATKFNLQVHLALGVRIPINERFSIITDASFSQGFINVGYSSNDYVTVNGAKVYYYGRNNSFSTSSNVVDYGTNMSMLLSARLNIKLGALKAKEAAPTQQQQ